jgi:hypothetical protein
VLRRFRSDEPKQYQSLKWNDIFNYAKVAGLDIEQVEYLENSLNAIRKITLNTAVNLCGAFEVYNYFHSPDIIQIHNSLHIGQGCKRK